MGKQNLEIENMFTEDFFIGNSFVCYTIISAAEDGRKNGEDVYFKVKSGTKEGVIVEGVGIGASFPLDESDVSDNVKEFICAVKAGKRVRVDIASTKEEWYDNGDVLKFRFIVYKGREENSFQQKNIFNPFADKYKIAIKRMVVTEIQENAIMLKNDVKFVKERKKRGEDIIYKVDLFDGGLALRSIEYNNGGSCSFTIKSEKVGKYYYGGYDIYARIKEIDDSDLDYCGIAYIKYDMIVLDED